MTYSNSLKSIIFRFVKGKYPQLVGGNEIERYAMGAGFKASNASRRCRELEKEGYIERELVKTLVGPMCVAYRYKVPARKTEEQEKAEMEEHLKVSMM